MLTESIAAAYRTSLDVIGRHCPDVALGALPAAGFATRAAVARTDAATWNSVEALRDEHFGPLLLLVAVSSADERGAILRDMGGTLATCIHCEPDEAEFAALAATQAAPISGRIVWQGFSTGVAVSEAMHHGGPWPAATVASATSVGGRSIDRLQRPLCIQTRCEP